MCVCVCTVRVHVGAHLCLCVSEAIERDSTPEKVLFSFFRLGFSFHYLSFPFLSSFLLPFSFNFHLLLLSPPSLLCSSFPFPSFFPFHFSFPVIAFPFLCSIPFSFLSICLFSFLFLPISSSLPSFSSLFLFNFPFFFSSCLLSSPLFLSCPLLFSPSA